MKRRSHAYSNAESRAAKARKIECILNDKVNLEAANVLEVGTGSGLIASYLARVVGTDGQITSVDVVDERSTQEGYLFRQVADTTLPFENEQFDVIVSNQVIEHVGEYEEQFNHLREIHRVLKGEGRVYFAMPNRWNIIEDHYKVAFLSWLPERYRSRYLKFRGKGDFYDCAPLSKSELLTICREVGLEFEDCTIRAMKLMLEIEPVGGWQRRVLKLPDWLLRALQPVVPTYIGILRRVS